MIRTALCELLGIDHPIIQAGIGPSLRRVLLPRSPMPVGSAASEPLASIPSTWFDQPRTWRVSSLRSGS
jgi:hypothetical protein